jgi:hypothetical protein
MMAWGRQNLEYQLKAYGKVGLKRRQGVTAVDFWLRDRGPRRLGNNDAF